jgi:polar amino acid transport system substrate-binding protein
MMLKKTMRRSLLYVFVLLWGVMSPVILSAEELFIYTCEEPPLNFTLQEIKSHAEGNDVVGFSTDVVREILIRTNNASLIQLIPWARAYDYALRENNTFIFSMARTEQRESLFQWVGPIARQNAVLYGRKDTDVVITSLDEAKQLHMIGTVRDDSREQYLKKHGFTNLESTTQFEQGFKKLMLGRIDVMTSSDLDAPMIAKGAGIDLNELTVVYTMYEVEIYIGVSNTTSVKLVQE